MKTSFEVIDPALVVSIRPFPLLPPLCESREEQNF